MPKLAGPDKLKDLVRLVVINHVPEKPISYMYLLVVQPHKSARTGRAGAAAGIEFCSSSVQVHIPITGRWKCLT